MLLRGPNLDPPLKGVRGVRIRYMWAPSSDRHVGTLAARFDAVNSPRADLQLHGFADLRQASTWTETELRVPSYAFTYTPLDVNYVYFEGDSASDMEGSDFLSTFHFRLSTFSFPDTPPPSPARPAMSCSAPS